MLIDIFLHSYIPLVFGLGFIVVTTLRSIISVGQIGKSPFVIDRSDPILGFVGAVFVITVLVEITYFGVIATAPWLEAVMGRIPRNNEQGWKLASVVVMTASLSWMSIAQFAMGRSWRIGVHQAETLELRTNGPFALSRNPIFAGMLGLSVGLAVWSPAIVPFVALTAAYLALEIQVRVEEAYLERTIGEPYRVYRKRVPRWL
jgi:protein-S-isoprenylcysteine O-methyltransferase Ste14